jgi:heptose I phosphotransferase
MRTLNDRENRQLELTVQGRRRRVYLKRHHVRSWRSRLRAWLGLGPDRSAGRAEARSVRRLEAAGIPCMELAAYGERLRNDGLIESFLITPELEGFVPLDDFLRTRFDILNPGQSDSRNADLLELIDQVAAVACRFHQSGFNHRDLYCCHFFVREHAPGRFEVRLIDLQRVQYRTRFRRRWLVKDLAQLAYSAPRDRVKCTQKLAFIRRYFGVNKLRPEHKRLVREILARQQAMERKLGLIA